VRQVRQRRPTLKSETFTLEQWRRKIVEDLKLLVAFVNFNFDDRPSIWNDLRRSHNQLCNWITAEFREETFPSWRLGALAKVQRLQKELVGDLIAVLTIPEASTREHFELEMLVTKLNEVLRSQWIAEPYTERIKRRKLAPYEGLLLFDNTPWTVRRWIPTRSFRQYLYGVLSLTLESGEFNRLKRCKTCQSFFVGDQTREFCAALCSDRFFGSTVNVRKRASRTKKLSKLAETGVEELVKISSATRYGKHLVRNSRNLLCLLSRSKTEPPRGTFGQFYQPG